MIVISQTDAFEFAQYFNLHADVETENAPTDKTDNEMENGKTKIKAAICKWGKWKPWQNILWKNWVSCPIA